ncbi:MAG: peptidoglycan DD-metalloendopeptidase family protein [Pelistega sp.]|nr:peptidoglycan DD-metalloendopeptidase family protein [Pelistega sp.]
MTISGMAAANQYIIDRLNKPVPGGVAVLPLEIKGGQLPEVTYQGHRVLVVPSEGKALAIVGIPLKTSAGQQSVQVKQGGQTQAVSFTVGTKKYKEQHIKLSSNKHVTPSAENEARFKRELDEQMNAYKQYREGVVPSNVVLDRPVDGGRYSSPFGLRRFFNGQERNPHSGLDIAVPTGTPIKAAADGVVTIVADYFFNGKTVFVDHGQGMITMYCHMSAIDVKKGQVVKRGELLGKVGSTGRSTGPHLHWNVSLNNVRVDPAIFVGAFQP